MRIVVRLLQIKSYLQKKEGRRRFMNDMGMNRKNKRWKCNGAIFRPSLKKKRGCNLLEKASFQKQSSNLI